MVRWAAKGGEEASGVPVVARYLAIAMLGVVSPKNFKILN
jgi:hypothetical protein